MKAGFFISTLALVIAVAMTARADEFLSNGVKIHYEISGEGEPVILIHGLYSSGRMNWDLPGTTAQLARSFRVIVMDARGHGRSDKPAGEDKYGVEMVEDVVRLMDHLKIKKARVAGYSMGGMIVMKLLALHPDRVQSAVLGGMGWLRTDSALQKFWEIVPNSVRSPVPPACLRGLAKLALTEEEVTAIKVPVTMIVGDSDPCLRLYVAPLAKIRPEWPVQVVPGAGHINCVIKLEFKNDLEKALKSQP